jgi:hypothetical protein
VVVAALVGGWGGRVVGAPTHPVAQTAAGSSSSGSGSSSGSSSSSGGSTSGSGGGGGTGSGDGGNGGAGSGGDGGTGGTDGTGGTPTTGGTTGDATGGTTDGGTAAPTTAPGAAPTTTIPADRLAEAKPTDCPNGGAATTSCYSVDDPGDAEAVRVPDGKGGVVVVPIVAVPVVDVDTGASTSASSNVDLRVEIDNRTNSVVRVERRVDPVRQLALVTLAALLGLFVGAAVLGTFLRFRRGNGNGQPT